MPTSSTLFLDSDLTSHSAGTAPALTPSDGVFNTKQGISGASDSTYWLTNGTTSPGVKCCGIQDSPVDTDVVTAIEATIRVLWQGTIEGIVQLDYYKAGVLIGSLSWVVSDEVAISTAGNCTPKTLVVSLTKAEFDALEIEPILTPGGSASTDRIRLIEVGHVLTYSVADSATGGTPGVVGNRSRLDLGL